MFSNKKFVALYLVWSFINIYLLISQDGDTSGFFPFTDGSGVFHGIRNYDFTEFFVYMALPLLIIYLLDTFSDELKNL